MGDLHKKRQYLPNIYVVVTRAAGQELVVGADGRFDVKRGVLVSTENSHCGSKGVVIRITKFKTVLKVTINKYNLKLSFATFHGTVLDPDVGK